MIKGLLISEQGTAQVIGDISSYKAIIETMMTLIPELQKIDKARITSALSEKELEELLEEKRKAPKTPETKKPVLEP